MIRPVLRASLLVLALAGALTPGCRTRTGEADIPTVEEAHKFIDAAEKRLEILGKKAARAGWVQNNFITVDTQKIAADAQSDFAAAITEIAIGARRFDGLQLPFDDTRKLRLLKLQLSAPAADNPAERDELSSLGSWLEGEYGKGQYCRSVAGKQQCLDINQASNILGSSRDPKELLDVWQGWHRVGAPMRDRYARFVELSNKGARELGFADTGAMWRSKYDMPPDDFAEEVDRLWDAGAAAVRFAARVRAIEAARKIRRRRCRRTARFPRTCSATCGRRTGRTSTRWWPRRPAGEGYDLTADLQTRGRRRRASMVQYGESFFTSLGFAPLPRDVLGAVAVHQAARIASGVPRERLGRRRARGRPHQNVHRDRRRKISYHPPRARPQLLPARLQQAAALFRDSANDGFHEAIGDTIALSVTPGVPEKDRAARSSAAGRLRTSALLLARALDKVAFLPFGLLIDQWRWKVFSGEIRRPTTTRRGGSCG